jgi:hypothetical protein
MKLAHIISAVIILFTLTGCETVVRTLPADYAVNTQEKSVVIGRVTISFQGQALQPAGFFLKFVGSTLNVVNEATQGEYIIVCDKNGTDSYFYVELPPGRYTLSQWAFGNLTASPPVHFVIGKGQVTYIGTLNYIGGVWSVLDQSEEAAKDFHERYPRINQEIVKSFMMMN